MRATLAVTLALVAVLGAVSVSAAGSFGATPVDVGDSSSLMDTDATPPNESNASMGAEVSAFMQASAADANGSVDEGMFAAKWNNSTASPEALVNARANALENRLDALERQKQQLMERKDSMSQVAYEAQLTRIAAQINAVETALNGTATRAQNAGVNPERLHELRERAGNLTGPEIAALARNLSAGVGPNGGPPDHARGSGTPPGQANNSTPGDPPGNNGSDVANNTTPGNGSDGGPGAGNGTDGGDGGNGGPGDDGTTTAIDAVDALAHVYDHDARLAART